MYRSLLCLSLLSLSLWADGPKDNLPDAVRPIPPPGMPVPESEKKIMQQGLSELRVAIDNATKAQAKNPRLEELLPDIEIYYKAVDWAMRYNEFYKNTEFKTASELILEGKARASAFYHGDHPWTEQKGLVLRAYRSRIDGSIQPYGMVIPENYSGAPMRLDFWCHGRGENLSELAFAQDRRKNIGQIPANNRLVLHPYGRYCCANKFAGEIDLWEAYEHARKSYAIDEDRLFIRGFSMGGAAVWQFGAHYTDRWCAINPGAGFAETPHFLNIFQAEDLSKIPTWQQTLWSWYNATDVAVNFSNAPTIAYSGEIDKQKQAADIMAKQLRAENIELVHIIGPQTAHKIHPDSMAEIERRLDSIATIGRDRTPREVSFATYFLRYNRMHWVEINRLFTHWEQSRIQAAVDSENLVSVKTVNIAAFTLDMTSGHSPLSQHGKVTVRIDGQDLDAPRPASDRSWTVRFTRNNPNGKWTLVKEFTDVGSKQHGLSGPIDDAFMDAFLFVSPTGKPLFEKSGAWVKSELERANWEWRRQFRGFAPIKPDRDITDADIAKNNLVLWGDPQSNAILAKIINKLPIKWNGTQLVVNEKAYSPEDHLPVMIFPNPLNPQKYVVLNSSFTYREYDYLNNARQVPKLPDWAVINLKTPANSQAPGGIDEAGFFNESWNFNPNR
jgi:pimeloyl-ACP methyl ester carboxylesterase